MIHLHQKIKSDDQKSKTNHQYKKKKNAIPQSIPNNKNFIIDEEKTSKIGMNFDSLEENLALFI